MRGLERTTALLSVTSGSAWLVYVLLFGSDAGLTVPVVLVSVWGGVAVVVLWIIRFVLHMLITKRDRARRRVRRLMSEPAVLLLCFAFVWSGAAFRVRFLLSRPAFDNYAQTAPENLRGGFTSGARVGLFWLREAEVLPGGIVRIITTDCMFDHCGVVYSPQGEPPRIGEDTYGSLGGSWYHWWRSW